MRPFVLSTFVALAVAAGCGSSANRAPQDTGVVRDTTRTHVVSSAGSVDPASPIVRALYLNRWRAQSWPAMHHFIAIADTTEINAFVIDMKDEFGLNYRTANKDFAKNAGTATKVPNLKALLDTLHAHNILPIARMVVFKDSVTARVHPEWTIRKADGSAWRDKQGLAWVNPYEHGLWDYNIGVAEELVKLGFGEIQFDYIRFPEPYTSLPPQVFPDSKGVQKPDILAAYLKEARSKLNPLGVRTTADVFGFVTTVRGALEIGQWWEKLAPEADVLLPMLYPSHFPRGSLGIEHPERRAVQDDQDLPRLGAISRLGSAHRDAGTRAAVDSGVHAARRQAVLRARADQAAEAGGVRRRLRRLGDVERRVEVRPVHSGAGEDAGVAEEEELGWPPARPERRDWI